MQLRNTCIFVCIYICISYRVITFLAFERAQQTVTSLCMMKDRCQVIFEDPITIGSDFASPGNFLVDTSRP